MLITDIWVHSERRCTDASGTEERVCRRLKLAIQPPGILIIWLDSDAKELFCLSHSNNTIVPSGSDCATLCNAVVTTVCVCVFLSVCLRDVLVALLRIIIQTCVCVCVCGIVRLHPAACVCISWSRGFSLLVQQCHQSLKFSEANAAQKWPRFLALVPAK